MSSLYGFVFSGILLCFMIVLYIYYYFIKNINLI